MQRKNWNKRPRYIPGIISLIFLPFIFIIFVKNHYRTHNINAVGIAWADLAFMESNPDFFESYRGNYPPKRDYTIIDLTGDNQTDKIKLQFAQIRIRELLATYDTLKGVHFLFGDRSNYGSFIKAIDICRVERAKTYMPYKNNVWFYNLPAITVDTRQKIAAISCGTSYVKVITKLPWWSVAGQTARNIWRSSWHVIIGFIVFTFFSVRLIYRQINNGM